MYLEMLYNIYGSALEKQAAAPDAPDAFNEDAAQPWQPSSGGGAFLVRKVTSPTGTVKRYQGSRKGLDYYKNMRPSNPGNYFTISDLPKSSQYRKAMEGVVSAMMGRKNPSEENERLVNEYYNKVRKKLKQRSRPMTEREPYVPNWRESYAR